jgi:four helix bundle protein
MIKTLDQKDKNVKYRSYKFALKAIKIIDTLPNQKAYWSLGDQLLRSATSIGANLLEATGALTKKDFLNFYSIALKSANETKFWLGLIRDSGKGDEKLAQELLNEVQEIAKMIGASILTIKEKIKKL